MKILILCKKIPFPAKDGESVAISSLAKGLQMHGGDIDLLCLNTVKHYQDRTQIQIPDFITNFEAVKIDNRVKILPAFINLFGNTSYNITRFYSVEFQKKLIECIKSREYDLVVLESIFLSQYYAAIRNNSKAKVALRTHNVEFKIWKQLAQRESRPLKKWYLNLLYKRLEVYEKNVINNCDFLVSITQNDLRAFKEFGLSKPSIAIPVGYQYVTNLNMNPKIQLFFLGSLDWIPNIEGLKWFIKEVFPIIKINRPGTELHIAGRNASAFESGLIKMDGVVLHGEVDDSREFMETYSTMVVPLFSGSGIRVKILEALSLGKAIVTTSKGCEGIGAENGRHLSIVNSPEDFAQACIEILEDNSLRRKYFDNGRSFIHENYSIVALGKKLHTFINEFFEQP